VQARRLHHGPAYAYNLGMVEIAVQIVVFGVVLAIIAVIMQAALMPRYQFMIQINGEQLKVSKGKVPADFLDNVRETCREFNIRNGWIGGVKRGKATALRFSANIPQPCQQRLRNMWFCP
jgi:hypothetical protein